MVGYDKRCLRVLLRRVGDEQLKEEITQDCCDDGYEDGHIHPFEHERNSACQEYGYHTYGMDS